MTSVMMTGRHNLPSVHLSASVLFSAVYRRSLRVAAEGQTLLLLNSPQSAPVKNMSYKHTVNHKQKHNDHNE